MSGRSPGRTWSTEPMPLWSSRLSTTTAIRLFLKSALDAVYHEWVRKPMAVVCYGGLAGGARAAEQLRLVAVELQMVPTRWGIVMPLARGFV